MAQFISISTFRIRLAALLKVKRGIYAGVNDEICLAFKDATIEQIRQNRDMILLSNEAVVIPLKGCCSSAWWSYNLKQCNQFFTARKGCCKGKSAGAG